MSDDIEDLISEVGNSLLNYASKEYVKIGDPADKRYENACEAIRTKFDALNQRIAELEANNDRLQDTWFVDETICPDGSLKPKVSTLLSRIAELEAAQRWIPVSERLPDGGHREFYEVACIYQDFGELALFSKGRWVIYEGENIYDVTKQVKFWRKRQYLPDEVIAILSKGKAKPEVQE